MKELKTLKDLDYWLTDELFYEQGKKRFKWTEEQHLINIKKIKAEAMKWAKEDKIKCMNEVTMGYEILEKWMKRLNISEEDLK